MNFFFLSLSLLIIPFSSIAQEGFSIEKGQFFEQGYGGVYDEEAMDLTEFGSDYIIAGWAEHQPDDQGGEGGVQYPLSKDAAIWYTNSIGAKQYY